MNYYAYDFKVEPVQPGSDILCALLGELGFESFVQNENGFIAYVQVESDNRATVEAMAFDDFEFSYTVSEIADKNWNEEWEKNFEPVMIGSNLCIRAGFHPLSKARREIVITPKMSFGTGHHQTTRVMCSVMLQMDFKSKAVLDMGCGTGVLAILAEMLGAREVLGIDNDEWSVKNAIENAEVNGCSRTKIVLASVPPQEERRFDVVLANINRNILKSQLSGYAHCVKPGGLLLMSGFFVTDIDELVDATSKAGFKFLEKYSDGEWAALKFIARRD